MRASITEKTIQSGNADVVMQPEVQLMSGQEDTFLSISWSLAGKLLDKNQLLKKTHAKHRKPSSETVVLLLGDSLFPEEQMQKFDEMIQPYLPRINHLTILYELNDSSNSYTSSNSNNSNDNKTDGNDLLRNDNHGPAFNFHIILIKCPKQKKINVMQETCKYSLYTLKQSVHYP